MRLKVYTGYQLVGLFVNIVQGQWHSEGYYEINTVYSISARGNVTL